MSEEEFNKEEKELELENRKWKNRRRLAYLSFVALVTVIILSLFAIPIERLKVLSDVITWSCFVFGSIIGFYFGASSWGNK